MSLLAAASQCWDRKQVRAGNTDQAMQILATSRHTDERRGAVVQLLAGGCEIVHALRRAAAIDDEAGAQARVALKRLAELTEDQKR